MGAKVDAASRRVPWLLKWKIKGLQVEPALTDFGTSPQDKRRTFTNVPTN
jgi:hypothetical protein